jgi:cytochrome d ubiquinol oxidase subunit II
MLIGIVFRGSAFAFRQYGSTDRVVQARWGRVFAVASVVTPFLLGAAVASLTGGEIRVVNGVPVSGYVEPWLGFFPSAVGLFAVALFATLAAVYLTNETGEAGLQDDFRRRALAAQTASCVLGAACVLGAPRGAAHFEQAFLGSWWTGPLLLGTGVVVIGLFLSLARRLFRLARMLAIAQVTLVLAGWGLGQRPYLIAPDVTIAGAASPDGSLTIVLAALAVGTPLLLPSLYWLFRVFKAQRQDERPEGERPEPRPPGSEAPRRTSQCG